MLFSKEADGSMYILKEQVDGRECSYKNEEDIAGAFSAMATLHLGFTYQGTWTQGLTSTDQEGKVQEIPIYFYADEMEKHTRECRHVKNYLKKLRVKSDFERALLQEYDYFLEKANAITALASEQPRQEYEAYIRENGLYCHGDYQYHNIMQTESGSVLLNFEKCVRDYPVRDLYLFLRKLLEKNNWSQTLGDMLLESYNMERTLTERDYKQLYYRLAYPEKFWKIVNFYYNSGKAWIPGRNMEKIEKLFAQEREKQLFLESIFKL